MVGAAAAKNADISEQAMKFANDFQTQYVAPALLEATDSSRRTQDRLDQDATAARAMQQEYLGLARQQQAMAEKAQEKVNAVADESLTQMQLQRDRYTTKGIPAEDRYYKMVDDYSEPAYAEQQAGMALGDIRSAGGAQHQQMLRTMAGLGINPNSPAAVALMTQQGGAQAAAEAAASNRARMAAQQLGMSLKADAANFGRGGLSSMLSFGGQAAGAAGSNAQQNTSAAQGYGGMALNANGQAIGATTGGYNVANSALTGATNAAGVPMAGYGTALKGYSANLDSATTLAKQKMALDAENAAGFGKFMGTAVGTAASIYASDRRLKKNIVRRGQYPSGLATYDFEFIDPAYGVGVQTGVMADEALTWFPEAVSVGDDGYYRVNYSLLR